MSASPILLFITKATTVTHGGMINMQYFVHSILFKVDWLAIYTYL